MSQWQANSKATPSVPPCGTRSEVDVIEDDATYCSLTETGHKSIVGSCGVMDNLLARVTELEALQASQQTEIDSKNKQILSLQEQLSSNAQLAEASGQQIRQLAQTQLRHFAMISHEIRNPMNCIIAGLSHLSTDDVLSEEHRECIEMITTSSNLLLAVVDDILDYSKLETESAGKVQTQMRPTALRQHLNAVVAALTPQARKADLELRFMLHADVPDIIETDERRLSQVLYNLIGNAVKFGETGQYIDFSVCPNENRDSIELSVTDYGKGIVKEEQQRIFEPFQQAATNEAHHGGTGLGLAISQKLVQALGGNISLKSEYGKYTSFQVVLPAKHSQGSGELSDSAATSAAATSTPVSEAASSEAEPFELFRPLSAIKEKSRAELANGSDVNQPPTITVPPTIGNRKQPPHHFSPSTSLPKLSWLQHKSATEDKFHDFKVLIAEDNSFNVKVLTRTLQLLGITEIDVVGNGQKAVEKWDKKDYKVIFMDMSMPIMDGIEATSIISQKKAEQSLNYPKIVFLTAHALQDYQDQAREAGGDGFISKPFTLDIIKSLLYTLVLGQKTNNTMPHPRPSSDMFFEQPSYLNSGHSDTDLQVLDGRIPHSATTTRSSPALTEDHPQHPAKPKNNDFVPQKPVRLSPSGKASLRKLLWAQDHVKPKPNLSPKTQRTKPRRQSGILCRSGPQSAARNYPSSKKAAQNMMMLTRTDSDRRILRNTLERKLLQKRETPYPPQR